TLPAGLGPSRRRRGSVKADRETLWAVGVAIVIILGLSNSRLGHRLTESHSVVGRWHVVGSSKEWRFDSDGAFAMDGLLRVHGHYELLSGHRLRVTMLGVPTTFSYSFDKGR